MLKTIEEFKNKIICGDCLKVLKQIPDNSVDAIITDPPAGIGFMGKEWDNFGNGLSARERFIGWLEMVAKECLRVLKPGGHALVWALPRTSHWTATAWENAGFEVRDRIIYATSKQELLNQFLETLNEDQQKLFWILMDESRVEHCFGSGFPKNLNIANQIAKRDGAKRDGAKRRGAGTRGNTFQLNRNYQEYTLTERAKQWEGWGTALKPAIEDWWLLRKPISEKTIAQNILKWGVGGLNIDACRIPCQTKNKFPVGYYGLTNFRPRLRMEDKNPNSRFPSHLIIDDSEEVKSLFPNTKSGKMKKEHKRHTDGSPVGIYGKFDINYPLSETIGDSGSASRFFYVAKASRKERDIGLGESERNNHPTVKPIKLMEYLIQLICPPNGIVLDPFLGSGTTALAAVKLDRNFIGIEIDENYCQIARKRIEYFINKRKREK